MTSIEPLTSEHFATVAGWLSSTEINQWLTSEWRDRVVDPALIGVAVRNKRNRLFLVWCEETPCGLVALADWDPIDKVGMIWYILGDPASGGRGVITEAVRQLVRVAFETLGVESLHAWIMEENVRSRKVLQKNGFREVGHLRRAAVHNGTRSDRVYFYLTRGDAGL